MLIFVFFLIQKMGFVIQEWLLLNKNTVIYLSGTYKKVKPDYDYILSLKSHIL